MIYIAVIGTIGVREIRLIDSGRELLGELKQNGFWIHDNIVEVAVHEAGE